MTFARGHGRRLPLPWPRRPSRPTWMARVPPPDPLPASVPRAQPSNPVPVLRALVWAALGWGGQCGVLALLTGAATHTPVRGQPTRESDAQHKSRAGEPLPLPAASWRLWETHRRILSSLPLTQGSLPFSTGLCTLGVGAPSQSARGCHQKTGLPRRGRASPCV